MSRFASNLHRPVWRELPTATGGRACDTSCHTRQFCGCRGLLAVAGIVALAVPLAFSLMHPIQAPLADAQSDGKGEAQFDGASIRLNKSHDAGVRFGFTDDGFDATNISVILLLKPAYGVGEDQKRKRMIRPLLIDRFQLRFHEMEKNVPVYTLVVSKNGSKLRPSEPDGPGPLAEHSHTLRMMGRGYVLGLGVPRELITQMLTDQLGRPVIDRTGLKGDFDFTLHWTSDEEVQPSQGQEALPQENTGPDSDWPTLLTAAKRPIGTATEGRKRPRWSNRN